MRRKNSDDGKESVDGIPDSALDKLPPRITEHLRASRLRRAANQQSTLERRHTNQMQVALPPETTAYHEYPIDTAQETVAMTAALSDCPSDQNWHSDPQVVERLWNGKNRNLPHTIAVVSRDASEDIFFLEGLTQQRSVSDILVFLYICSLAVPLPGSPLRPDSLLWIGLDDVAAKTGLRMRTQEERDQAIRHIWDVVRFFERVRIQGQRTGYPDSQPVRISDFAWSLTNIWLGERGYALPPDIPATLLRDRDKLRAKQLTIFDSLPPDIVGLTLSPSLRVMLQNHRQFIRGGNLLAQIPTGQPAGAMARSLGLALAYYWRRNDARDSRKYKRINFTRADLLGMYPPPPTKSKAGVIPTDALTAFRDGYDNEPARFVRCYINALRRLTREGFLFPSGEAHSKALQNQEQELSAKGRRSADWREKWLAQPVELHKGKQLLAIESTPVLSLS